MIVLSIPWQRVSMIILYFLMIAWLSPLIDAQCFLVPRDSFQGTIPSSWIDGGATLDWATANENGLCDSDMDYNSLGVEQVPGTGCFSGTADLCDQAASIGAPCQFCTRTTKHVVVGFCGCIATSSPTSGDESGGGTLPPIFGPHVTFSPSQSPSYNPSTTYPVFISNAPTISPNIRETSSPSSIVITSTPSIGEMESFSPTSPTFLGGLANDGIGSSSSSFPVLFFLIMCCVGFVTLVACSLIYIRNYNRSDVIVEKDNEFGNPESALDTSGLDKSFIVPADVVIGRVIGHGGHGRVFEAHYGGSKVAAKEIVLDPRQHKDPINSMRSIWREVGNMRLLVHPNVIQFYGIMFSNEDKHRYLLILELAVCSLNDMLSSKQFRSSPRTVAMTNRFNLGYDGKLRLAKEICAGMSYIHQSNVIHFDLKPENVLLDREGHAKICDLGIAKVSHSTGDSSDSNWGGTPTYMAPERVIGSQYITPAVDVYSFGILLWQLFHEDSRPHPPQWTLAKLFHEVGRNEFRPEIRPDVPERVKSIIIRCWHQKAEVRPTFLQLRSELYTLDDSVTIE